MVYGFRKMCFIGQSLKHVHITHFFSWTFDLPLIESSRYLLLGVYFSHITEILYVNTNSRGNQSWNNNKHFHLLLSWNKTNIFTCFFTVKLKFLMNNFNFSQFHKHIFRSSLWQMFLKIGALKKLAIFWIKKRL